jgi:MFS family permease
MSTPAKRRWTLVATILASAMTFIDGTVVNVALPALQAELHATIIDVQWVVEAYALFLGALILVGGSMGDQLGRKRVFLFGTVFFTASSVLCGVAGSPRVLIAGRALQGIGAAFLVPGSLSIISATFDASQRGRAIGTWSGFSAITMAVGPVIGGWLIQHVSWRAAFFINVPVAGVVLALSLRFMDESRDPSRTATIDRAGAALVPFAIIMFVLSRWAGGLVDRIGAKLPLTLGPIVASVGIALLARAGIGNSYWSTIFPAVCLLGFGMTMTVAPLTTTVMGAVDAKHSGVASGVNNAVARVAGLLAIAIFGVFLVRAFDAQAQSRLDRLSLAPAVRAQVEAQLPKMAGAQLNAVALDAGQRRVVQRAIDEAFVSGVRMVIFGSAILALAAAGFGSAIRDPKGSTIHSHANAC